MHNGHMEGAILSISVHGCDLQPHPIHVYTLELLRPFQGQPEPLWELARARVTQVGVLKDSASQHSETQGPQS